MEGENRHNLQTAFASTTIQVTIVWATTIRATTIRTISPFSTTTADPIMEAIKEIVAGDNQNYENQTTW
jgi:hypothetical protein